MKSNKEFYNNLYIKKLNRVILVIMLLISIFTFSNSAMFLLYGVVLIGLTIIGFKQYLLDILVAITVMIMTSLQYATNLGLINSVGNSFTYISIACIILTLVNFFLIRYNYKIFVLNMVSDSKVSSDDVVKDKISTIKEAEVLEKETKEK